MSVVKTKMADAAAARREARRRKILENSHNRLQIISGKTSNEISKEHPVKTLVAEPEYDFSATPVISSQSSSSQQLNGALYNPPADLLGFLSGTHDIDASGDAEVVNDLASLLPPTGLPLPPQSEPTEAPKLSVWEKIVAYKYDIVLLSLFLQILYSFSISFDGYVFLPVLIYIATKMIWFPAQSNSSIANMLMLLNGVSPARIQKLLYLSQCFGAITRDIFVFLFTTICIQSLCVMLRENFVA